MGYYENILIELIGPRCESRDLDDLPGTPWKERCFTCKTWEAIDGYVKEKRHS